MGIDGLIGNTPLVKIHYNYKGERRKLYAKLEMFNLTGSIKDRLAYYIIKDSKMKRLLKDKQPIIEVSNGNTALSFAAIGAYFKHPVHVFIPDWVDKNLIKMYGANIHTFSKEQGFQKTFKVAKKLAKEIDGFFVNQFENLENVGAHYKKTAIEIINEFPDIGGFVSGVGTGGTLSGIGKRLKEYNPKIKVYAVEPDSLPLLSTGENIGSHKINGIGYDFIPIIYDRNIVNEIVLISDIDAINMSRIFAQKMGLGIGISSGANFLASAIVNRKDDILTIFVDDNKKYIHTDLHKQIDEDNELVSNSIELIKIEVCD